MGFCRTGLFKRLESSGYSFLLSLSRHILRNYIYIHAIENNLAIPIGAQQYDNFEDLLEDEDVEAGDENLKKLKFIKDEDKFKIAANDIYQAYLLPKNKNKYKWIDSSIFEDKLLTKLKSDTTALLKLMEENHKWNPADDRQLNALKDLCFKTHKTEKVLIFTQFADTAEYLYEHLKGAGVDFATGGSDDPTTKAYKFSPVSNEKNLETAKDYVSEENETRILITTDVLSEGQNLQDCHIVVNYDLPWAIIRLIQRAGRVDRIGQQSSSILCYSFLPEENLEKIIKLRERLKNRIKENAEVVGSDEIFFEGDPINLADLYNEKAGILDDEDDSEVDLSSFAYEIWKNATNANPGLAKIIPNMPNAVYTTKFSTSEYKDCVILYAKTTQENDSLVMLDSKGEIVSQSPMTILKNLECNIDTPATDKIESHHEIVEQGLKTLKENLKKIYYGSLGTRSSAKYRAYTRLNNYYENQKNSMFENERLKIVIDEILQHPLREVAKDSINRQIKTNISDEALAELIIALNDEGRLVIPTETENNNTDPMIICSLGLK